MKPGTLSERLRWAREASGLSARKLSERAGLKSASHVALIESGEKEHPQVDTMSAIAGALGVSIDWLFAGRGDEPTAEAIADFVRRGSPDESGDNAAVDADKAG